jgi:hypothetical protein
MLEHEHALLLRHQGHNDIFLDIVTGPAGADLVL